MHLARGYLVIGMDSKDMVISPCRSVPSSAVIVILKSPSLGCIDTLPSRVYADLVARVKSRSNSEIVTVSAPEGPVTDR